MIIDEGFSFDHFALLTLSLAIKAMTVKVPNQQIIK